MFNKKLNFHKREIKEIKNELTELYKKLCHIFFNKISTDEAIYRLEKTMTKFSNWNRLYENMDENFKRKISYKFKNDLNTINKLSQIIKSKIEKKGKRIKTNYISMGTNNINIPDSRNEQDIRRKKITNKILKLKDPEGIVGNFHQEMEIHRSVINTIRKVYARILDPISGRLDPPTKKAIQVWKFTMNVQYPGENLTFNVPIEMRGSRLKGHIQDGDQVQIYGKWKWSSGDIIEVMNVYNKTTRRKVKVTGSAVKIY